MGSSNREQKRKRRKYLGRGNDISCGLARKKYGKIRKLVFSLLVVVFFHYNSVSLCDIAEMSKSTREL